MNYQNYALGKWITGEGEGTPLYNAITGEELGRASWPTSPVLRAGHDLLDQIPVAHGRIKCCGPLPIYFRLFIPIEKPSRCISGGACTKPTVLITQSDPTKRTQIWMIPFVSRQKHIRLVPTQIWFKIIVCRFNHIMVLTEV